MKFGRAFPDTVGKVRYKIRPRRKDYTDFSWQDVLVTGGGSEETEFLSPWRKLIFSIFIVVVFFLIFVRLFHLQIVEGKENRELADSNRIKVKVIHAPRGVIYDRNGKILAQNEPGFRLVESTGSSRRVTYITRDEALKMEVAGDGRFKDLEIDSIRSYTMGERAVHILGYVSEITEEELQDQTFKNYKLGDKIGRTGVEETYERVLRGVDGGEIIEIDAGGHKIRTLRKTDPIPGQNLYLTIDADLQVVAYRHLQEQIEKAKACCGALVAQDPKSGQVLALVSIPAFSPNDISKALVDSNSPMLNRVVSGVYPPGSTYKIATALSGLESGKITESTIFQDTGVVNLGPYSFSNWYFTQYGKTEGPVDVVKALQRSNDIFFYLMGQQVGEKVMGEVSRKLGLGKKLGIDIQGEALGVIPDNDWKVKNIGTIWYPGDTLHMSIGQGFVLTTPLQINNLISIIANNGKQYPPHLSLKITNSSNKKIKEFDYSEVSAHQFKKENMDLIKKGLALVPKDGGTAWPFFTFPIATGGKTGTAEFGDPKKTHAWYTAYGPIDNPTVAVTVLIEKGGEGSSIAAPVVKEVMRWYFSPDKTNLIKDLTPISSDSARLGE